MADIVRVSIVGSMPNGEEFSVNPVFKIGGDFGAPVTPTQAQTIATAVNAVAVPGALLVFIPSSCAYTGVRIEARSLTGALESQAEAVKASPSLGTSGSSHPFQVALVSSLRTGTPGGSGRGRLYWPATGATITASTLRPSAANMTSFAGGVKTYLSGISAAIQATLPGTSLTVWSRLKVATYPVSSIQVGDVLDTQRRRRDTLIESYTILAYP